MLFVNGLPVATAELKTDLTQNIQDAVLQYRQDRPPKDPKTKEPEPLLQFKTRALVHFAVSTDEVFMATKLEGAATSFLPFNQGKPDGWAGPAPAIRPRRPARGTRPGTCGRLCGRATSGSTSSATFCTWSRRKSRSTASW